MTVSTKTGTGPSDSAAQAGRSVIFRSDRIEVVQTPFRAPQANGVAERFVRTVRTECLDWLLVLSAQHLERILEVSWITTIGTGRIERCRSRCMRASLRWNRLRHSVTVALWS
jgi:transposase InsO family protein